MPNLVVITFDGVDKAGKVLETLRSDRYEDSISLDDSAIVVKDEDGTVQVDNEVDRGVKVGAIGGSLLGLLIGLLLGGPIASLVLGAIAGALGGDLANLGIDQRFINDVAEAMTPGTSALFVMVREGDTDATVEALEPFEGAVYYAHLPEETEEELRRALSDDE
jgi:uncharacterized membrane protein